MSIWSRTWSTRSSIPSRTRRFWTSTSRCSGSLASILETALAGREWLCADNPTIADIAVAAPMHLHAAQKLPLDDYPNIRGWIARVEALPCWQNSDPIPHIPAELLAKLA